MEEAGLTGGRGSEERYSVWSDAAEKDEGFRGLGGGLAGGTRARLDAWATA